MAVLAVTNTFVSGTSISASQVNTNYSDIVTWLNNRYNGTDTWSNVKTATLVVSGTSTFSGLPTLSINGTANYIVASTANGGNAGVDINGLTSGAVAQRWKIGMGIAGTDGQFEIRNLTAGTNPVTIATTGTITFGNGIATNATDGFIYVSSCAGTPTGVPTTQGNTVPIVWDRTNHKLYVYSGGGWKGGTAPGAFS